MVTGIGYSLIENAKKDGVPESQIMEVPGPSEMLAAVVGGRAAAAAHSYLTLEDMAEKAGGKVEVTDPQLTLFSPKYLSRFRYLAFVAFEVKFCL
ncbi:hypothetical protein [Mesorhizobium sp. 128a]